MLSPLLYLAIGIFLGKHPLEIKGKIAKLLTMVIIPIVIVYNIATHKDGTFVIMFGMVAIMLILLLGSRRFHQ